MKKNQIRKSVAALAMAAVVSVSLLGYGCGSKSCSGSSTPRAQTACTSLRPSRRCSCRSTRPAACCCRSSGASSRRTSPMRSIPRATMPICAARTRISSTPPCRPVRSTTWAFTACIWPSTCSARRRTSGIWRSSARTASIWPGG